MQSLPPIVLECPECGEKYLISRESYMPSEKATIYSDGFFMDDINWRTPRVIGCVTCELGFFPECGKVIAEPDWAEFNQEWSHIKKAEPPTAGSLVLELRARKNMTIAVEKALRIELWGATAHSETGRILMTKNKKFNQFCNESLVKLESILSTSTPEEVLMKAEINRQLKHFDRCIELLNEIDSPIASLITLKAENKESELFVVS